MAASGIFQSHSPRGKLKGDLYQIFSLVSPHPLELLDTYGHGSKPTVPFWDRRTTHVRLF